MASLVCNYCSCPPRVDPECPPQSMACIQRCSPAPSPAARSPGPVAPAQETKGLPGWVIALIGIAAILLFLVIARIGHQVGWF
jgi:hypothetical protein